MTHPLTDEIIDEIQMRLGGPCPECHDDIHMRAAYDKGDADRLEQVIEWLQINLGMFDEELGYYYIKEDFLSDKVIDEDKLIDDLKKAMRPVTAKQEDN